jgi:hypothetical protein
LLFLMPGCKGHGGRRADATVERAQGAVAVVDAVVPGTQVFWRDRLLGTCPVQLGVADVEAMGLSPQRLRSKEAVSYDGYCQFLVVADEFEQKAHLMYRVPDDLRDRYLTIETPWGWRSKHACGQVGDDGVRADMALAIRSRCRMALRVTCEPASCLPGETVAVSFEATNHGDFLIVGENPRLSILCHPIVVGTRGLPLNRVELPATWSRFKAGEVRHHVVTLVAPTEPGHYSVFGIFALNETEESEAIVNAAVYSDSRMLTVTAGAP